MTYGTPPIELYSSMSGSDPGDLSKHSIYPTFFSEFAFRFTPDSYFPPPTSIVGDTEVITPPNVTQGTTSVYNKATNPGRTVQSGTGAYYASFQVNTSLLNAPNVLHFDLYSEDYLVQAKKCSTACVDVDVDSFAPFSHDAQSGTTTRQVPEPSTLSLFGVAATLLAAGLRRFAPGSVNV
jgi:hypothetical protein